MERIVAAAVIATALLGGMAKMTNADEMVRKVYEYCQGEYDDSIIAQQFKGYVESCFRLQKEAMASAVEILRATGLVDKNFDFKKGALETKIYSAYVRCVEKTHQPKYDTLDFYRFNQCVSAATEAYGPYRAVAK